MKYEKSCGGIVYIKNDNHFEVLLVHMNEGHWSFPKGHVEPGETEQETALREIKEETNIDCVLLEGFREVITYSCHSDSLKDVVYFLGIPLSKETRRQIEEIKEVLFIELSQAILLLTHDNDKELLRKVKNFLENKDLR